MKRRIRLGDVGLSRFDRPDQSIDMLRPLFVVALGWFALVVAGDRGHAHRRSAA
jgi:hypothetical protein